MPEALVIAEAATVADAAEPGAAKRTVAPDRGVPAAFVTSTASADPNAAPVRAVWLLPPDTVMSGAEKVAEMVWFAVTLLKVLDATAPTETPSTRTLAIEKLVLGVMVKACDCPWMTVLTPAGAIAPLAPAEAVMVKVGTSETVRFLVPESCKTGSPAKPPYSTTDPRVLVAGKSFHKPPTKNWAQFSAPPELLGSPPFQLA